MDAELEAVNDILSAIGESPVNTLENTTNIDVINALKELNRVNKSFQGSGWAFNIVPAMTLNPNEDSHKIDWNDTFLRVQGSDGTRYVKRGAYLFDFTNQTDIFMQKITPEVILLVPYDEMPAHAQKFIVAKAARKFATKFGGDPATIGDLQKDETMAWAEFQTLELEANQFNMLSNPSISNVVAR